MFKILITGGGTLRNSVVITVLAVLTLAIGVTGAESDSQPRYAVPAFGYSAVVPADWSIYMETDSDTMAIVSFGLPEVWSELEGQSIENAISITAHKRSDLHSVQDLIDFEARRKAAIIVSSVDAGLVTEPARLIITKINGYEYKTLAGYRYRNGIGYEISFTATEGTYDINLQHFLNFVKKVEFFALNPTGPKGYPSRYQEASLLYRTKPDSRERVISLLQAELESDSTNLNAATLLTIVLFDSGRYDETLALADRAINLNPGGLTPAMYLYKGKALYELGRYMECQMTIGGLWAIFQESARMSSEYDDLMAKVAEKLKTDADTGQVQPEPK